MRLVRVSHTAEATYGVLLQGQIPFAVTLEKPWEGNVPSISCIPHGIYQCKRVKSPKFGETFEVTDVPGRSHILFHMGNLETDTSGCLLIGESFNRVNGKPGITASKAGFGEFMRITSWANEFQLEIVEI